MGAGVREVDIDKRYCMKKVLSVCMSHIRCVETIVIVTDGDRWRKYPWHYSGVMVMAVHVYKVMRHWDM